MVKPEGSLTPSQFEIMQMLWDAEEGLTVSEIWELIRSEREINRTTALNLVDRLEKRGWLRRKKVDGLFRYSPAVSRQITESKMASEFVGDFFDGSPSSFVLSLLGSKKISKAELQRLKSLLNIETENINSKKRKG